MALLNQLDEGATAEALGQWLGDKLGTEVTISELEIPKASGMSMSTVLFRAATSEEAYDLVARVAPSGAGLFEPDLAKEFGVLDLMRTKGVTVPNVRWLETDPSVLGSAFMVMDRVAGRVPGDDPPFTMGGWVLDLPPEERGRLWSEAVRVMAEVHGVDWRSADPVPGLGGDHAGIDDQLQAWETYYRGACGEGRTSIVVDAALDWLRQHRPADGELVLNWGDSRLGNIIYGEQQEAKAALDWELATIADPGFDVGWFVLFIRFYTEAMDVELPEGMPTRSEALAEYERCSGRTVADIDWYEAFAAVRLAMIFVRIGTVMVDGGAVPKDSLMAVNNPSTHMLAKLLDLPAPEGDSSNFVGNR